MERMAIENRLLANILAATSTMTVGKTKAARIVGGERTLERLHLSGAIECAGKVNAQPIKAYAEGTKGKPHPGGLALVGDGGSQELVMYDGKAWVTPDQPTLLDLPKGAEVIPDVTPKDLLSLGASLPTAVPRDRATGQPIVINDYSALENRMVANTKAVTKALREHQTALTRQLRRQKFNAYIASRI